MTLCRQCGCSGSFDPYFAFDLSYSHRWSLAERGDLVVTVGAIDAFDEDVPNVRDNRGVDLSVFDQRGRRVYASLNYSL